MKKAIILIILLLLITNKLAYCQFIINEINKKSGNSKELCIDSILSISLSTFDSIVLNQLEIPNNIDEESDCIHCVGTNIVGFMLEGKKIISTKVIIGFNQTFDSIILKQHRIIVDNIIKYSKIKSDNYYYIILPIRYLLDDYNEYKGNKKFVQIVDDKSMFNINIIRNYVLLRKKQPVIIHVINY